VALRFRPADTTFYDLFTQSASHLVLGAGLLAEMLGEGNDREVIAQKMRDAEHAADETTHDIVRRVNTTFVTPFDREDIYALASNLDDVVDSLEAAADMLVLHRVTEPIDAVVEQCRLVDKAASETAAGLKQLRELEVEPLRSYWIRINELENEGDRLYRHARADLYSFDVDDDHPARYLLMWKDIVDEIERALDELEHVAHTVESIVLKNA
jgi:hypothetical protein